MISALITAIPALKRSPSNQQLPIVTLFIKDVEIQMVNWANWKQWNISL